MYKKLKILLLSPCLPTINTSACARKIYDCIKLLHQRGHLIYLLSFCSKQDEERIDAVRSYCAELNLEYIKDYSCYPRTSALFENTIDLLCKRHNIDILQCEKAYMIRYVPKDSKAAFLLIEHEVLSTLFSERLKLENNFINKLILFARKIKKCFEENRWYQKFNKIIVFSGDDKDSIRKLYNIEHVEVIPLGINLDDYPSMDTKEKLFDLIFVGNFSHSPNTDAVSYFYIKIWPLIKNRLPNVSVVIIGDNLPPNIKKLVELDKNISVSGYIENVQEYYYKSRIAIAPIRYGTGMRFKVLEAMALNIPVVSTSIGARGIISNSALKIADNEKDFANTVIELLNNQNIYKYSVESARSTIEKYYNWSTLLNKYERIYFDLLK